MLFGIQIIGLLFAVIMMYFTFLYYKKAKYDKLGLAFWLAVWSGFAVLILFPSTFYGLMQTLAIERTADFLYAAGLLVFSVVIFHMYTITKQTQKKMEMLVRKVAITNAKKKTNKKK